MTARTAIYTAANAARWAARLIGVLLFLFLLAFFVGEGPPRISNLSTADLAALSGWIILGAGFLVAWKWEAAGGLMILAAVLWKGKVPAMWLLYLCAGIGLAHVLCAVVLRQGAAPVQPARWPRYRNRVLAGLGVALGGFLLLAANEMFGMPPLMTPRLRPPESITGVWQADVEGAEIRVAIGKDSAVTGSIAGVPITAARLMHNRSWFGRLMKWRTEYIIIGDLAAAARIRGSEGNHFTAPLRLTSGQFAGALFLAGRNHTGSQVAAKPVAGRVILRRK